QRSYLEIANNKLNSAPPTLPAGFPSVFASQFISSGDERAYYRGELRALNASITAALAKTSDHATKVHLENSRDQIGKILDPNQSGSANVNSNRLAMEFLEMTQNPTSCWHDYTIKK
ncbi:MAG: hypothetical protein MUC29_11350, partial [Pyrinomonadaceae bacterium]|nr:hypothetical protein [Pyrinomonadaceae bacterium]